METPLFDAVQLKFKENIKYSKNSGDTKYFVSKDVENLCTESDYLFSQAEKTASETEIFLENAREKEKEQLMDKLIADKIQESLKETNYSLLNQPKSERSCQTDFCKDKENNPTRNFDLNADLISLSNQNLEQKQVIQILKKDFERQVKKNSKLKEIIDKCKVEIKDKGDLRKINKKLKNELKAVKAQAARAINNISLLKDEVLDKEKSNKGVLEQLLLARENNVAHTRKSVRLLETKEKLENQLKDLQEKLSIFCRDAECDAKLKENLSLKLSDVRDRELMLKETVREQLYQTKFQKQELKVANERMHKVKVELDICHKEITEYKEKLSGMESKNENLTSKLAEAKVKLVNLEEKNAQLTSELSKFGELQLDKESRSIENFVAEHRAENKYLKQRVEEFKHTLSQERSKFDQALRDSDSNLRIQKAISADKAFEIKIMKEKISKLEKTNKDIQDECHRKTAKRQQNNQELLLTIDDQEKVIDKYEIEIKSLVQKLKEKESEKFNLSNQIKTLEDLKNTLKEKETAITKLNDKIELMTRERKVLQKRCDKRDVAQNKLKVILEDYGLIEKNLLQENEQLRSTIPKLREECKTIASEKEKVILLCTQLKREYQKLEGIAKTLESEKIGIEQKFCLEKKEQTEKFIKLKKLISGFN